MSVIWGIVAPQIDLSLQDRFNRMTNVMPFSNGDAVNTMMADQIIMGHSTIGTFHRKGYPVTCQTGNTVTICGVPIWEGDHVEIDHSNQGPNDSVLDAELIQFARNKDRLADVGGVYAFAEWDPESKELLLGTDRLGFRSLYYTYDPIRNILCFASRLRGLTDSVVQKNDINWRAILEFLQFGYPLGDKTFYSDINLIPPGSLVKYSSNGMKTWRYWDINNIQINQNMSYHQAIEINAHALKKSIKRRIKRCENVETIVLLSGGIDSRRIAGELHNQAINFETFTTRGFSSDDSEGSIAAEVARELGRQNTFIDLPIKGFVKKYWARSNRLVDYECCLHQWLLPFVEKMPKKNVVNYDGIAGDIIIDVAQKASSFYNEESFFDVLNVDTDEKVKAIIGEKLDLSFLKDRLQEKLNEALSVEDLVKEELLKYEKSENQLMLFVLMNRTRRSVSLAPNRILQSKMESMFPYLDIDVLKASLSVPLEHRLKHTLRRDIVQFAYPQLGKVPYTQYKKQIPGYTKDLKKKYYKEKRCQLRSNIWSYFIKSNKAINAVKVGPKLITASALTFLGIFRVPYEFSMTFQVFYEWLYEHEAKDSELKDV